MSNDIVNISSFEEFEIIILNLTKSLDKIKEALNYEENSSKRFEDKEIWDGKAGESISNKIKEYRGCFPTMIESLESYIKFLQEIHDNYKNAEETINKSIMNNEENLNVN